MEYIGTICLIIGAYGMLLALFTAVLTDPEPEELWGIVAISAAMFSGGSMLLLLGSPA